MMRHSTRWFVGTMAAALLAGSARAGTMSDEGDAAKPDAGADQGIPAQTTDAAGAAGESHAPATPGEPVYTADPGSGDVAIQARAQAASIAAQLDRSDPVELDAGNTGGRG